MKHATSLFNQMVTKDLPIAMGREMVTNMRMIMHMIGPPSVFWLEEASNAPLSNASIILSQVYGRQFSQPTVVSVKEFNRLLNPPMWVMQRRATIIRQLKAEARDATRHTLSTLRNGSRDYPELIEETFLEEIKELTTSSRAAFGNYTNAISETLADRIVDAIEQLLNEHIRAYRTYALQPPKDPTIMRNLQALYKLHLQIFNLYRAGVVPLRPKTLPGGEESFLLLCR